MYIQRAEKNIDVTIFSVHTNCNSNSTGNKSSSFKLGVHSTRKTRLDLMMPSSRVQTFLMATVAIDCNFCCVGQIWLQQSPQHLITHQRSWNLLLWYWTFLLSWPAGPPSSRTLDLFVLGMFSYLQAGLGSNEKYL